MENAERILLLFMLPNLCGSTSSRSFFPMNSSCYVTVDWVELQLASKIGRNIYLSLTLVEISITSVNSSPTSENWKTDCEPNNEKKGETNCKKVETKKGESQ